MHYQWLYGVRGGPYQLCVVIWVPIRLPLIARGPHAIAKETVTEVEAAPENQELHPIAVLIGRL